MTSKSLWMDIDVAPDAEVLDGVNAPAIGPLAKVEE
jgi:hypothetical protein